MSETFIGTVPFIGLIILSIACWFYMWGGRSGKWKRRFIGSFICSLAIILEYILLNKFKYLLLLIYPLTIATFVLGYGADLVLSKIKRRFIVVSVSVISSIGICLLYGGNTWFVLPLETWVALSTIYLGVKNPVQAAAEEYFVCLFLWAPKLIYPFANIAM